MLNDGHVLYYKRLPEKREYGVSFLINKDIAGNIDELYSRIERIAGIVIKLNKTYKLKLIQGYIPTTSHNDEGVEQFYEDVETAINKVCTQYTLAMGGSNAKIGKKLKKVQAVGNYGVDDKNSRGEMLVEFAERNQLRLMNTFFKKREDS